MQSGDKFDETLGMNPRSEGRSLLAVLSNPVGFYCFSSRIGRSVHIGAKEFNSLEGITYEPEIFTWLGFFDWLRPRPGDVIGIRLNQYVVRIPELFEPVPQSMRFFIDDGDVFLFFSDDMEFDENYSCDQSISDSQFMVDSEGTYAVAFQADDLSDEEWKALNRRIVSDNGP